MLLKKYALIGSVLMGLGLPVIASADLVTNNNTNEVSTVKVTSSFLKSCSVGGLFNKFTPAMSTSKATLFEVRGICQQTSGTCEADVYATPNCNAGGAKPVAHVAINLSTLVVTSIQSYNSKYSITSAGSTVFIRYA